MSRNAALTLPSNISFAKVCAVWLSDLGVLVQAPPISWCCMMRHSTINASMSPLTTIQGNELSGWCDPWLWTWDAVFGASRRCCFQDDQFNGGALTIGTEQPSQFTSEC